jgi:ferredoxin
MIKTISKIYFSPTGNTRKTVDAMAAALGGETVAYDVTVDANPAPRAFAAEDFAVFGAPVYGGRIPKVAAARLKRFTGNRTPCIVAVTYGNRHYDDALLELADMAKAQGFAVKGAAALIGRHTYGDIQAARPDADDLAADMDFARKAAKNPAGVQLILPGNRPYKDGGNGGGFRPLTSDKCTACGLCVANCPVQAIAADCKTVGDHCISCFRCIRICPEGAKNMNDENYISWAAGFTERLKNRRENEYFLS